MFRVHNTHHITEKTGVPLLDLYAKKIASRVVSDRMHYTFGSNVTYKDKRYWDYVFDLAETLEKEVGVQEYGLYDDGSGRLNTWMGVCATSGAIGRPHTRPIVNGPFYRKVTGIVKDKSVHDGVYRLASKLWNEAGESEFDLIVKKDSTSGPPLMIKGNEKYTAILSALTNPTGVFNLFELGNINALAENGLLPVQHVGARYNTAPGFVRTADGVVPRVRKTWGYEDDATWLNNVEPSMIAISYEFALSDGGTGYAVRMRNVAGAASSLGVFCQSVVFSWWTNIKEKYAGFKTRDATQLRFEFKKRKMMHGITFDAAEFDRQMRPAVPFAVNEAIANKGYPFLAQLSAMIATAPFFVANGVLGSSGGHWIGNPGIVGSTVDSALASGEYLNTAKGSTDMASNLGFEMISKGILSEKEFFDALAWRHKDIMISIVSDDVLITWTDDPVVCAKMAKWLCVKDTDASMCARGVMPWDGLTPSEQKKLFHPDGEFAVGLRQCDIQFPSTFKGQRLIKRTDGILDLLQPCSWLNNLFTKETSFDKRILQSHAFKAACDVYASTCPSFQKVAEVADAVTKDHFQCALADLFPTTRIPEIEGFNVASMSPAELKVLTDPSRLLWDESVVDVADSLKRAFTWVIDPKIKDAVRKSLDGVSLSSSAITNWNISTDRSKFYE